MWEGKSQHAEWNQQCLEFSGGAVCSCLVAVSMNFGTAQDTPGNEMNRNITTMFHKRAIVHLVCKKCNNPTVTVSKKTLSFP